MSETTDKNPKNQRGFTPLHHSAMLGFSEVCQVILENVDEKNPVDEEGTTPLHLAARGGKKNIFRLIFEQVAEKNPVDGKGNTPLHYAATQNECTRQCEYCEPTPLKDYLDICQLILDNVVDKHPVNNLGHTPLDLARGAEEDEEPHYHFGNFIRHSDEELLEVEKCWLPFKEVPEPAE